MKMNYNIIEAVSYSSSEGILWQLIDQDNTVVEDGFESSADAIDWALANNYVSPQHEYDNYVDECRAAGKSPISYTDFRDWLKKGELESL